MPCSELRGNVDEPDTMTLPTPGYRVRRRGGNPGASRAPRALLLPAPRLLSKLWGAGDGRAAAEADAALDGDAPRAGLHRGHSAERHVGLQGALL